MSLQKWGGISALYMAMAYIIGIALFIFLLDYPHIVEPMQKVALLAGKTTVMYLTNLMMYVLFGITLIVFSFALYERLKAHAPAIMGIATVIGFIWAGLLFASGMISNAGIGPAVALFQNDPDQALQFWSMIETVANGLSCAHGEILGGLMVLLVSIAAYRAPRFPKALVYLGGLVGVIGIVSAVPGLNDMTGLFGMSQIIWFVWMGIIMMRRSTSTAG